MRRDAEVILPGRETPVNCIIWDWSEGGARLAVDAPLATLPSHFKLVLYRGARVHRNCKAVWTDARFVGVKFI